MPKIAKKSTGQKNLVQMNFKRQNGFLKLPNDNMFKTITVAILLCLVCSIIVSSAAVMLKPTQVANKLIDKKRNILAVAGIEDSSKTVDELFEQIETTVVDLETGEVTDKVDPVTFDQERASKEPATRVELTDDQDIASIGARSKYANVYLVKQGNEITKIILPVKGYGLWTTLYGFLALEGDGETVVGITFYEHGETPGLGGEIDNKKWQESWTGKKVFGLDGDPKLGLIKGTVDANTADAEYKIDGLAGATLTSNGVTNLVQFWAGENGFGPFLERVRNSNKSASTASVIETNFAYINTQSNIRD